MKNVPCYLFQTLWPIGQGVLIDHFHDSKVGLLCLYKLNNTWAMINSFVYPVICHFCNRQYWELGPNGFNSEIVSLQGPLLGYEAAYGARGVRLLDGFSVGNNACTCRIFTMFGGMPQTYNWRSHSVVTSSLLKTFKYQIQH